jgi:hypothetical protein
VHGVNPYLSQSRRDKSIAMSQRKDVDKLAYGKLFDQYEQIFAMLHGMEDKVESFCPSWMLILPSSIYNCAISACSSVVSMRQNAVLGVETESNPRLGRTS